MKQASYSKHNNWIQNILGNLNVRKFIISVLAGILCLSFSGYNISYIVSNTEININWSLIFPILISMVYGMKAGGISAISGGALYPFLLWPENGWANVITSISLLVLFVMLGYIYDNKIWKSRKIRFHYRAILYSIVYIGFLYVAYLLIFNKLLAINPPFWISDTINGLSNPILLKLLNKNIVNLYLIFVFSDSFIRLPIIRRFFGLHVNFWMRGNTQVFLLSISIALLVWLSFYFLDNMLNENNPLQDKNYLRLSFMIIFWSGGIIGRVLIHYLEAKLKTEKLLNENQEKLIRAQKLAKLGSWELDVHTQVITLSAGHQELIGEKSQRTTMPLFEYAEKYIVPEDKAIMREKFDLSVKNIKNKDYTGSFEYRIKTHTGEIKHLSVRGRIKMKGIVIGTIQDISERVQTEKIIQEKNETYLRLFESSNVPILILDANFVFIDCNEMALKTLERPKKEIIGASPIDKNISPKFQPCGRLSSEMGLEYFSSVMKGSDLQFEWVHLKKDGTEFPVELSLFGFLASEKKKFFVMWKDLTLIKRKEKELKNQNLELHQLSNELTEKNRLLLNSKNKFKNLFDKSPVSIWEQDYSETIKLLHKKKDETKNLEEYLDNNPDCVMKCVSKMKILNVNNKTLELIGVKNLDELVRHIRKSNNKISVNILKNELLSIASGKKDFYGETEFIKKDGTILHAIIKSTMLDDKGKNIASVIDITKMKKTEEELVSAKEKAEESDQLKTEFINNMSHEIRTPLNGILGFSEMLNNTDLTDEKRANFIKIIQSGSHQLLHIIDDILEISRLGTKQVKVFKSEVCINDVLMELFSIFEDKAKENKTPLYLEKALSDKQSTILTDKTKLVKVLSNLLENALKFTVQGFIEFGYQLKNNDIELYVKDTGIGIAQEKHKIIFDRFSQAEKELSNNVGGLGLGLSIAKENIELLGGTIRLESKKDEGASFFITIPYKPVLKEDAIIVKDTTITTKNQFTILIAEDEEVNFMFLEILLKDVIGIDCKVIHAINGQEAIEICRENKTIDLVLMDLKMPVMNGHEATQHLKKLYPDLPIIAQTAYSTQKDQEKASLAGCDDFISKPIRRKTMSQILEKHLAIKL